MSGKGLTRTKHLQIMDEDERRMHMENSQIPTPIHPINLTPYDQGFYDGYNRGFQEGVKETEDRYGSGGGY